MSRPGCPGCAMDKHASGGGLRPQAKVVVPTTEGLIQSFRAATGIDPRPHQVAAVLAVCTALTTDCHKETPSNYLCQHATGSGKSLTMAMLAHALTQLVDERGNRFALVVVVSDRRVLDEQNGETLRAYFGGLGDGIECVTSCARLRELLSSELDPAGSTRVTVATLQKAARHRTAAAAEARQGGKGGKGGSGGRAPKRAREGGGSGTKWRGGVGGGRSASEAWEAALAAMQPGTEEEVEEEVEDPEQPKGAASASTPTRRATSCPVAGWLLPWDDVGGGVGCGAGGGVEGGHGDRGHGDAREQAREPGAGEAREAEAEAEAEGSWLLSPRDLRCRHVTPSRLTGCTGLSLRICEEEGREEGREEPPRGEAWRVLPPCRPTGLRLHEEAAVEAEMAEWLSGAPPRGAARHAVLCAEAASPSAWPSPSAWRPDAPPTPAATPTPADPATPAAGPSASPLAPASHSAAERRGRAHRALATPPPPRAQPGRPPEPPSRGGGRGRGGLGRGGFGYVPCRGRGRGPVQSMVVGRTLSKPQPRPTPAPVACAQPRILPTCVPSPSPQPSSARASKLQGGHEIGQHAAPVAAPRTVVAGAGARVEAGGEAGGEAEGSLLFARLCALDPSAEAADYQLAARSEAWDLQGLRSDIELVEEAMAP